ncbi:MAG: SMC family ATPase [Acidobacteria bacterium]|nr:SMC family ATPase [Acidobacteriota bacterium]
MHVTRVELENIKSYERGDFSFERGTTAIVGENGAGKTTILEAIAWAIFDTLDYPKDDFLRRGAKKGSVRVTFEGADGRQYMAYRDTGQGYYVYDDALKMKVAEKKADVKKFLDQCLGIEPGTELKALFRSAIGVPQGLFTTEFLLSPTDRKKAFDRLLKVEEYRESAERLRDTANLINERTVEARVRISGAESQLARYDEITDEHKTALARVGELDQTLAELQLEAEARARAVSELDEAERRVAETRAVADRLEVEHASAGRRLADLQSDLAAARRAVERQRDAEADYRAHLDALDSLKLMEAERAERDRVRAEAVEAARMAAAAEADVRRIDEAFARASQARASLAELAPDVARQEELERERERLRDLLARARAARERLAQLERELEDLRGQHAELSRRVRASEGLEGAQARAENLESERTDVETRLSGVEKALAERKPLARQRRDLAAEIERLLKSITSLEREAREFEQSATAAARLPELEAHERALTHEAAALRAATERDEKTSEKAKGGVCPILHEPCKNLAEEGRTFEDYFAVQLKTNRAQLVVLEKEGARISGDVRAAREAEKALARSETTRARLAQERALLDERESTLARLDSQLAALAGADERLRDELRAELTGVHMAWKKAHEDALLYAEVEPLRAQLKGITDEGKRRKEEREELSAAASAEATLTQDIREAERALRELRDPRGRAAALRVEAEREAALQIEAQGARDVLQSLQKQKAAVDARLERFVELDAKWSQATAQRDRTIAAYREYLESASLAATLPARETEATAAEEKAAQSKLAAEAARREHESAVAVYDRERHGQERGALALARERAAATVAQAHAARDAETRLAAEIARLDEVRASLREEFLEKERLERMFEATDFIRDTLKKAGPLVTESYLYNISIEANQLFRDITGEGGRALKWSKDYDIVLEEGGHERPFANLSGGEQMVAALSVRLALLKQLSDIRVAFFDEPTVNMDAERRERLAQQIGLVRDFDQLFVISHDDTFEEAVDNVVAVTRGEAREVA